jgi:MFS family permease
MGVWFTSAVTAFMISNTLGVLLPSISAELDLSPSEQGLLGSATFWGNLILAIPLSWWVSKFRPKMLTFVTLLLGTAFIFAQAIAPLFLLLFLGRLGFGITILVREPARAHLIRQWFSADEAVIVNGFANMLFGIVVGGGLVLTPILLGYLENDWRVVLYVYTGIFSTLAFVWIVLGRERPVDSRAVQEEEFHGNLLKSTLAYRDIWIAGLGFAGATMSFAAFINFYPTLMLSEYQIPLRWSGGILALGIFMGGPSGLLVSYYVSRTGKRRRILQAFGLLMVLSYIGMTNTSSLPLLFFFNFLNGISWGFFPILYSVPFVLKNIRTREVAIAVSFITFALSFGSIFGSILTGYIQEVTGDLQQALLVISFTGITLTIAGSLLRLPGTTVSEATHAEGKSTS